LLASQIAALGVEAHLGKVTERVVDGEQAAPSSLMSDASGRIRPFWPSVMAIVLITPRCT